MSVQWSGDVLEALADEEVSDEEAEDIDREAAYWREYVERSKPGDNNCLLMALMLLFVPIALGVAGVMAWL